MKKCKRKMCAGRRLRKRQDAEIKRLKKEVARLSAQRCQEASVDGVRHPEAALIFGSEVEAIRAHVLEYSRLETGGSLYGWWSETGLPVIALATGPGKNAQHHECSFHADEAYSFVLGNALVEYGLQHIGEWHSHHHMTLSYPSGIDCDAMRTSLATPNSPIRRFFCGIANIVSGEVTFNAYYFSKENGTSYAHTPIFVKPGCSPIRAGLKNIFAAN